MKPKGARANSWKDVADISAMFGVGLDGWQELILEAAMGERSDQTWAAKRVGISVPRQNGKSQLLVSRALAGALLFGEKKIVVSAHQQDTARESFAKLMEIIESDGNESLRRRLDPKFGRAGVMNALNREAVRFSSGATIQFKARSGAAGKGFSSDCLLLDEAQILGSRAWTSINSTMSAMRNPQVWLLGTPPQEEDDSYTFEMVRDSAISGKSTAAAWCEWSADPVAPEYDPASEFTRWSANPAWNTRINHEVVQGEFETYSPDRFSQDRLGMWRVDQEQRVISKALWDDRKVPAEMVPELEPAAFGLDMSHDRVVSVAVCLPGEVQHVEVAALDLINDTLGVVEWLVSRAGKKIPVVVDSQSPAASMIPALKSAGVAVLVTSAADMAKACGEFFDAVVEKRLSHFDQDPLNLALSGAKKRLIGTAGGWGWDRKDYSINLSPLVAVTLAKFGANADVATSAPSKSYAF